MSTISLLDLEQSDGLAKRFAHLACSYFDKPSEAKTPAAKIPLENLFRILQMFRYDTFSDEPRSGILAIGGFSEQSRLSSFEDSWHRKLQQAISIAIGDAFGGMPPEDAVAQIQSSLAWLATDKNPPTPETRTRSKAFLERLSTALG